MRASLKAKMAAYFGMTEQMPRPVESASAHGPISQNGSIAPVYILFCLNDYLLGGFRLTHDPSTMPMLRISFSIS